MNLYKAIDVWKRLDDSTAVRFRCFESLRSGRFCVQSADFYRLPLHAAHVANLDRQFVELFVEQEPSNRNAEFTTLEEAILMHDKEFL